MIDWNGWQCLEIETAEYRLICPLEVGPRVLWFSRRGGPNHLRPNPGHFGLKGGTDYRSYGGHRLWIGPEDPKTTYTPENEPVRVENGSDSVRLESSVNSIGIKKEIELQWTDGLVTVRHRVENCSDKPIELAAWAVTVMAPGGQCIIPGEPSVPHPEGLLPNRRIILWPYSEMSDPRFTWGSRTVRLSQTDAESPVKFGSFVSRGVAAYTNFGETFVKLFEADLASSYPDMGCNFEAFTRHDMLEVETLGPLRTLTPGKSLEHVEKWMIFPEVPPIDDVKCEDWLLSKRTC